MSDHSKLPRTLTDGDVEAILRRAIAIEHSKQHRVGVVDVKAIAAEIGVSGESVDQAILELEPAGPVEVEVRPTSVPWRQALLGASVGVLLMGSTFSLSPRSYDAEAVVPVLVISVALTAFARSSRPIREYLVKNAGLWTGYALSQIPVVVFTAMVVPQTLGAMVSAILSVTAGATVQASVFGSAIVWLASGWKGRAKAGAGSAGSGGTHWKRTLARKLEDWIERYLKRIRLMPVDAPTNTLIAEK